MGSDTRFARRLAALLTACVLLAPVSLTQAQDPVASGGGTTVSGAGAEARLPGRNEPITLNFRDAELDSVIGAFGHLLNRTFLIDPRVRGKITLETPKPVTRQQAYQLLQASLRAQGFAIVESGDLSRVVPEADAKLQSGPVNVGRSVDSSGDQIITQIFRLNYESVSNVVPVLRPLITANNTITAYPNNNSLVITDYAANLQRLARIISTLDSPSTNEIDVLPIRYAIASDIAVAVTRMLDDTQRAGQGAQVDPGQRVIVQADMRSNAVLVRASSLAKLNLAKALVARLDQPSAQPGNVNVVYLRNAEAVRLAQVLRGVLSGDSGALGGAGGFQGMANNPQGLQAGGLGNPQPGQPPGQGLNAALPNAALNNQSANPQVTAINAGGAIIAADSATNSLIITAPEPIYRNLRAVIDKLDARRAQVFIESLIVEVSADKAAEMGLQFQFLSAPTGAVGVVGGSNLTGRGAGSNILDVAVNPLSSGQGLNIGIVRNAAPITINGVTTSVLNLGALARALETKASANILATPNLLTLDNEEARIIIGQNVPFVTGQFTNTGTTGSAVSPFQTIERKDVGTTLRVRPQVSEGGTIKMQIFQEVSSVNSQSAQGLITNRRAIESNVLVDDGQIVVLGGLIEERLEGGENKVPGLGDVPFLGNLFRYDTRRYVKTNLMVFLRPVVVRNAEGAQSITADRYDYIRQMQGTIQLPTRPLLPELPSPQVPTQSFPPGAPAPAPESRAPSGDAAAGVRTEPLATPRLVTETLPAAPPQR